MAWKWFGLGWIGFITTFCFCKQILAESPRKEFSKVGSVRAKTGNEPSRSGSGIASQALIKQGLQLLKSRSCLACHSLDGSAMPGPSLYQLYGKNRSVLREGKWINRVADEQYLRDAISEPDRDRVRGYEHIIMPKLALPADEVKALVAAIRSLQGGGAQKRAPTSFTWIWVGLIFFSGLFVFGHLGLSSMSVRRKLIEIWGDGGFLLTYSIIAILGMSGLIYFWSKAPYVELWKPYTWTRYVPFVTMPFISYFFIFSFMVKNPTAAGQEETLQREDSVQGILKITRHPGLWSFAMWGIVHLFPNGDLGSVFLFGSIIVLALAGMFHIESRRRVTQGDAWMQFCAKTSLVPFVALLQGKTTYSWRDLGLWPTLLAVGFYVLALLTHQYSIGVSPWPW